ncbi:MAG: hypothetical protein JST33_15155 [Actinobacteria bacterium]|nr:hypothetical protein [Actinomycetota bacterium]
MTEHRVVILGEARVDEIRDPGGVRESVAGDAVELATELRAHGLSLTVVAPVGEDSDGERIRTALRDRGIRLVPLPAPGGTPRRSIVRDRVGAEIVRSRGESAFPDTRRSLAAQADADLIVDLRDREVTTLAEERDDVLRALGLSESGVLDTGAPADASDPVGTDAEEPVRVGAAGGWGVLDVPSGTSDPAAPAGLGSAPSADAGTISEGGPGPLEPGSPASTAEAPGHRLLPAPITAGTYRHSPVRLLPEPLTTRAPFPDRHGLEERISRIAT